MKKKMIAVLVLALVVSTASVFALGIGAQSGWSTGFSGALSVVPDGNGLRFAVNGYVGGVTKVGITADKWIANKTLAKPVNYFYGLGAAGDVSLGSNLSAGVYGRLVAGINSYFLDDFMEIYLQAAWQPGLSISIGNDFHFTPVISHFPVDLGIRFWL